MNRGDLSFWYENKKEKKNKMKKRKLNINKMKNKNRILWISNPWDQIDGQMDDG